MESSEAMKAPAEEVPAVTRPRRRGLGLLVTLVTVLAMGVVGEIALRATGRKPWDPIGKRFTVEPGGTMIGPHPELGYVLLPGNFKTVQTTVTWNARHLDEFHRATRPVDAPAPSPDADQAWFF